MKRINYADGHAPTVETLKEAELEYNIKDKVLYTIDKFGHREAIGVSNEKMQEELDALKVRGGTYATNDENNSWIVNESVWGDTNVGAEQVYIDCQRVGDMVTIAFDIMLSGFSVTYPSDVSFSFEYKLSEAAKSKGWFKGIHSGRGTFTVEVSPGDSSFSAGRCYTMGDNIRCLMGETARGSADATVNKAYVHGTMVLRVHD